jgi:hypothetical protein
MMIIRFFLRGIIDTIPGGGTFTISGVFRVGPRLDVRRCLSVRWANSVTECGFFTTEQFLKSYRFLPGLSRAVKGRRS